MSDLIVAGEHGFGILRDVAGLRGHKELVTRDSILVVQGGEDAAHGFFGFHVAVVGRRVDMVDAPAQHRGLNPVIHHVVSVVIGLAQVSAHTDR